MTVRISLAIDLFTVSSTAVPAPTGWTAERGASTGAEETTRSMASGSTAVRVTTDSAAVTSRMTACGACCAAVRGTTTSMSIRGPAGGTAGQETTTCFRRGGATCSWAGPASTRSFFSRTRTTPQRIRSASATAATTTSSAPSTATAKTSSLRTAPTCSTTLSATYLTTVAGIRASFSAPGRGSSNEPVNQGRTFQGSLVDLQTQVEAPTGTEPVEAFFSVPRAESASTRNTSAKPAVLGRPTCDGRRQPT